MFYLIFIESYKIDINKILIELGERMIHGGGLVSMKLPPEMTQQ